MNPSYFRIKLPEKIAVERLCRWMDKTPKETIETSFSQSIAHSLDENGQWKGGCLFVYENEGWTVFEDLSGGFSGIPAESWQSLAESDEFMMAGYNNAVPYGELIAITGGVVQKEFLEDLSTPEANVNNGDMFQEVKDWTGAAGVVDDDGIVYSEQGTVMIF